MNFRSAAFLVTLASTFATTAVARSEQVIHNFPHGAGIYGSELLFGGDGSLIGPRFGPRILGGGSIFRLAERNGVWREQTLHKFMGAGDGNNPASGLAPGPDGVYYGTTEFGPGNGGCGTAFSLARRRSVWTETQIHVFRQATEGCQPLGKLLLDKATGTFFGTAYSGGAGAGTVFALRKSAGSWTLTNLYNFGTNGNDLDALTPQDGVRFGTDRNTLLGVAQNGGANELGAVFMLVKKAGAWTETVLHSCAGYDDCAYPEDIDVDDRGNIFGVDDEGGHYQKGTVFELSNGAFSVLHSFGDGSDGVDPVGIYLDRSTGDLFGVTETGGTNGDGALFELTQDGEAWTESVLHNFGAGADGSRPDARPVEDPNTGNLYGTTNLGGGYGGGAVWTLTR